MKICVPILAKSTDEAIKKIEIIQKIKDVDLIEIWCGEIEDLNLKNIFKAKKLPLVLNCKGKDEKGSFEYSEEKKLEILNNGANLGAEYCDFSFNTSEAIIKEFVKNKKKTKLILSEHFWKNTPNLPALLNITNKMIKKGADIVKVATYTECPKDLINILRLAENLQRKNISHITIAMDKLGSISRFLIPEIFSGEFTFAPLEKTEINAPGQLSVNDLRKIENILK